MKIIRFLLDEPDDGAGGATQAEGDAGGEKAEAPKMAKFGSQLSPEIREKYKDQLSGDYAEKHLNDVWEELMSSKSKLNRAVIIPDPESPDDGEVKQFFQKMGIPEKPDGYELNAEVIKDDKFIKQFKEQAHKMGLTQTQAKKQLAMMENLAKAGNKTLENAKTSQAEAMKKAEQTFPARLTQALDGNEQAAEEVTNLATKFHVRMGNKELIEKIRDKGLLYDTEYMKFSAKMEKLAGDDDFIEGDPGKTKQQSGGGAFGKNYSPQFAKVYGR